MSKFITNSLCQVILTKKENAIALRCWQSLWFSKTKKEETFLWLLPFLIPSVQSFFYCILLQVITISFNKSYFKSFSVFISFFLDYESNDQNESGFIWKDVSLVDGINCSISLIHWSQHANIFGLFSMRRTLKAVQYTWYILCFSTIESLSCFF